MVGRDPLIAVYILANGRNGTLYTGVTSTLVTRIRQHKLGTFEGFSKTYGCRRLVWYEVHAVMGEAIRREKQLKRWRRDWKLQLIEAQNPDWRDLSDAWFEAPEGPGCSRRSLVEGSAAGSRVFALWRALRPG